MFGAMLINTAALIVNMLAYGRMAAQVERLCVVHVIWFRCLDSNRDEYVHKNDDAWSM